VPSLEGVGLKLLVIGSGGREHALVWKLAQSERVREIFLAPGNPGIALEQKTTNTGLSASDFEGIAAFCLKNQVTFVVVGPDQALADGAVDFLEAKGIATFGPVKAAAKLESSKAYSKEIMQSVGIPTARFEVFTDLNAAEEFLARVEWGDGWVVKADGLALGKGVVVCESRDQALITVADFLGGAMGEAGKRIVVEERLLGRELSAFSICDGERGIFLGFACDYKRIYDGDRGPNTGGMGAFSPADWMPADTLSRVQNEIVDPLLREMSRRGAPYKGILFTGLMITKAGPKVIEFNARFGDPETQALLPLLDEDLLPWLEAARNGKLASLSASGPKKKNLAAVHVVLAAEGYPGSPRKGASISFPPELLPKAEGESLRQAKLFFAGVAREAGLQHFTVNGGRVMGLTAIAPTREEAKRKAYELISTIHFEGAQRRSDVGS
jgi:phosphoribosylamine--glycine ligase